MKLYYYTTIETLALILDSKSIRFTRLDFFDDLKEIEPFKTFNPLKWIFALCHTKDYTENIPLWKMYSSMDSGVRIEFDKNVMFKPQLVYTEMPPNSQERVDYVPLHHSVLSDIQIINDDYMAIPAGNVKGKSDICQYIVYKDVVYDDNFAEIYLDLLTSTDSNYDNDTASRTIKFKPTDFGFYKTNYWKFQQESRFLIYTTPFCNSMPDTSELVSHGKILKNKYIDVKLSDDCFENMKIILSPNANKSVELLVKALIKDYPKIDLEYSQLKGCIR